MKLVAIDPGLSGAIAYMDTKTGELTLHDMPVEARIRISSKKLVKQVDRTKLHELLQFYREDLGAEHLFVEQVNGMPGQSAPAAFQFGVGYGVILMSASVLRYIIEPVYPLTWKTALRCPADKHMAVTRANELLPTHRSLWAEGGIDRRSGKAEAAMLALYGEKAIRGTI